MTEWAPDWPTEPGWYWFYGHEFGDKGKAPTLVPVEVSGPIRDSQGGESVICVAGSHFLYRRQAEGVWTPMQVPEVPA